MLNTGKHPVKNQRPHEPCGPQHLKNLFYTNHEKVFFHEYFTDIQLLTIFFELFIVEFHFNKLMKGVQMVLIFADIVR